MPVLAANKPLFPKKLLLLVTLIILALLFLFLPFKDKVLKLKSIEEDDQSQAWLLQQKVHKLLAEPQPDPQALLAMSQKLRHVGDWPKAREVLQKVPVEHLAKTPYQQEVIENEMLYYHSLANKTTDEKAQKQQQFALLQEKLQQQSHQEDLSSEQLKRLAEWILAFELPWEAQSLFVRLAEHEPENGQKWWSEAARWAMAVEDSENAADYYQKAMDLTENGDEKAVLQFARLDALRQAENLEEAGSVLETILEESPDTVEKIEHMIKLSLELGRPEIAHRLYAQLAVIDSEQAIKWLQEAATWALSNAEHQRAAAYLADAVKHSSESKEQQALRLQQLDILMASEAYKPALELMEQVLHAEAQNPKGNDDLLLRAIKLARDSGHLKRAIAWNQRYLDIYPEHIEGLLLQTELHVAQKEPDLALGYLRQAVAAAPKNIDLRKRLADMEEWRKNPKAALEQWRWLATYGDKKSAAEAAIARLSQTGGWKKISIQSVLDLAKLRALSDKEIKDLVYLYHEDKRPDAAIPALQRYLQQYPAQQLAWQQLLYLQQAHTKPEAVLITLSEIAQHLGHSPENLMQRVRLYRQLKQDGKALKAVENYPNFHPSLIKKTEDINVLADLTWTLKQYPLATGFYQQLWAQEPKREDIVYRLYQLYKQQKQADQVLNVAKAAWQTQANPDYLLERLRLAQATQDRTTLQQLFQFMEKDRQHFEKIDGYLLVRAATEEAYADYGKALYWYRKAAKNDPTSMVAKRGILAMLMQNNDKEELLRHLLLWDDIAQQEKRLWPLYAMAYQKLGELDEALLWYERQKEAMEDNYPLILSYADVLEKTGNTESAARLRWYALQQLQEEIHPLINDKTRLNDTLQHYLVLLQHNGKAEEVQQLYELLWKNSYTEKEKAKLAELAIAWRLSAQEYDHARYWLMKAHQARIETPAWQELAVALHDKDKPVIKRILASHKNISLSNKVRALSELGKNREALQLALQGKDLALKHEREAARELAFHLAGKLASHAGVKLQQRSLGQLDESQQKAFYHHKFADKPLSVDLELEHTELSSDTLKNVNIEENTLRAKLKWQGEQQAASVELSHQQRDKSEDLTGFKARYDRQLNKNVRVGAELALDETSYDSEALRLQGKKNRLQLDVYTDLGENRYLNASLFHQQHLGRKGGKFAEGQGVIAEAGYRGEWKDKRWRVGLQGSYSQNDIDTSLPEELERFAHANGAAVLAEEAGSIGVVASLNKGNVRSGVPQKDSLNYYAETWAGQSLPNKAFGVRVSAGVGTQVLGADELSVEAYYSNIAGVERNQEDSGISVQYQHFFGVDTEALRD